MAEWRIDITKVVERAAEQLKAEGWRPEIISKFVPFDESDYIKIMRKAAINGPPLFKGKCARCRGNCFDDDNYCATCGAIIVQGGRKMIGFAIGYIIGNFMGMLLLALVSYDRDNNDDE